MVPQHVSPAEESVETAEVSELKTREPEQAGATLKEHNGGKVSIQTVRRASETSILALAF